MCVCKNAHVTQLRSKKTSFDPLSPPPIKYLHSYSLNVRAYTLYVRIAVHYVIQRDHDGRTSVVIKRAACENAVGGSQGRAGVNNRPVAGPQHKLKVSAGRLGTSLNSGPAITKASSTRKRVSCPPSSAKEWECPPPPPSSSSSSSTPLSTATTQSGKGRLFSHISGGENKK